MATLHLPKLVMRVRFPSQTPYAGVIGFEYTFEMRCIGIKRIITIFMIMAMLMLAFASCKKSETPSGDSEGGEQIRSEVENGEEPGGEDSSSAPSDAPSSTVSNRKINYLTGETATGDNTIRPVAVMISNAKVNIPQSGISNADIIYEAVTEGGVTRLMALYSNMDTIGKTGSIRSARDQFIQLMLPLNAIYVHIGTSTSAKRMLDFYSYNDIDGIYLGFLAFQYDTEMAKIKSSEHCWFTNSDLIKAGIEKNSITTKNSFYPAFNFTESGSVVPLESDDVQQVKFSYSGYSDVTFTWDKNQNKFLKTAFGVPHTDAENGQQLAFDNVFIILTDIGIQEENGILPEFDFESGGSGWYFYGGKMQEITWKKGEPVDPLIIMDKGGNPIKVNTGKTYVGVLGNDRLDTVEIVTATEG